MGTVWCLNLLMNIIGRASPLKDILALLMGLSWEVLLRPRMNLN